MKGQMDVETPAEYIAAVDEQRRPDIAALDARTGSSGNPPPRSGSRSLHRQHHAGAR